MLGLRHGWVIVALLACVSPHARAEHTGTAASRKHYEAGKQFYQNSDYTSALREFSAGYRLDPRPAFLINLGQCYRKLNQLVRARDMYQRYLNVAATDATQRTRIQAIVAELDGLIAEHLAQVEAPSAADALIPRPAQASTVKPTAITPTPAPAPTDVAPQPVAQKKPIYKKWWFWTTLVLSAGAVAGITVGVIYATRPSWQTAPPIGPGTGALTVHW